MLERMVERPDFYLAGLQLAPSFQRSYHILVQESWAKTLSNMKIPQIKNKGTQIEPCRLISHPSRILHIRIERKQLMLNPGEAR